MTPASKSMAAVIFLSGVTLPAVCQAEEIRVVDGDTIKHLGITYRLHGIDAPEAGQKCENNSGKSWSCGQAAISFLKDLIHGSDVSCVGQEQDGYGRTIGICYSNGSDISSAMVSSGHAWAFRRYSLDYAEEEEDAQSRSAGIWQGDNVPPWDFRAQQWAVAEQESPEGCPIKGNISDNGNIYHAPWSPWYGRTKVSVEQGERWFCDEAEAVEAGWRAPYWGR